MLWRTMVPPKKFCRAAYCAGGESWEIWRLLMLCFHLSSSVQRTLASQESMPMTCAAGQRNACLVD
jgi:hypothetical protein